MKPFSELTDIELVALTADEIERYTNRALMEAGIPKPVPADLQLLEDVAPPAVAYYKVKIGGTYSSDYVIVSTADEAARLVDVLQTMAVVKRDYGPDYDKQYAKPVTTYEIESLRLYTMDEHEKVKDAIARNKVAAKHNDDEESRYKTETKNANNTVTEILDTLADAHTRIAAHKRVLTIWDEYVETCGGDTTTAMKFLRKVCRDQQIRDAAGFADRIPSDLLDGLDPSTEPAAKPVPAAAEPAEAI